MKTKKKFDTFDLQNLLPCNEWYSGPSACTWVVYNGPVCPTAQLELLSFSSFFFTRFASYGFFTFETPGALKK